MICVKYIWKVRARRSERVGSTGWIHFSSGTFKAYYNNYTRIFLAKCSDIIKEMVYIFVIKIYLFVMNKPVSYKYLYIQEGKFHLYWLYLLNKDVDNSTKIPLYQIVVVCSRLTIKINSNVFFLLNIVD